MPLLQSHHDQPRLESTSDRVAVASPSATIAPSAGKPHHESSISFLKHRSSSISQKWSMSMAGYSHVTFELSTEFLPKILDDVIPLSTAALAIPFTATDLHHIVYVGCHWKQGSSEEVEEFEEFYRTVDLVLDVSLNPPEVLQSSNQQSQVYQSLEEVLILKRSQKSLSTRYFLNTIRSLITSENSAVAVLKLILPLSAGYVARSDFLETRLRDCPRVGSIHSFLRPLERCDVLDNWQWDNCGPLDFIDRSAGVIAVTAATTIEDQQSALNRLEKDLHARLNVPWILEQICSKRVALVRGRSDLRIGGPVYSAAAALGINLVIVDEESHWLQPETEENILHREAFLVTDMTENSGLVGRIVQSLKQYPLPIDGIFTLSDNYLVTVSEVATALGLPTCPTSAFETAVDKYLSRLLQDNDGTTAKVFSSAELESLMLPQGASPPVFSPRYPMIVKPTKGWSSECVAKVSNKTELIHAVEIACERHRTSAVIETYIEGPEIDVNFILQNGKILFVEVVDELPSGGDAQDAGMHENFSETGLMFPSILPCEEQVIAINTLRDMLIDLGFLNGVFHVEARIADSSVEYGNTDGVIDLMPTSHAPEANPRCRLIEINARPPGHRVTLTTKNTYGIDFYAAQILSAVDDSKRLQVLSQPFRNTVTTTNGAQYWSRVVYVTVPSHGTVKQVDACEDLKQRCPDLVPFISISHCYFTKGDRVSPNADGASSFFAHLVVFSRQSRLHVMEIANRVQAEFRIDFEDDELATG